MLYTGHHLQLVLMTLQPGEEIGAEVHEDRDQFFRFEEGAARSTSTTIAYDVRTAAASSSRPALGTTSATPATSRSSSTRYTARPSIRTGVVQSTKAEAEAVHEEWDGETTE